MSSCKSNESNHNIVRLHCSIHSITHYCTVYDNQLRKFSNRNVPIHLNWKGMFHDSSLFVVTNTEAEAVDGLRDNLDTEQATMQSSMLAVRVTAM